MDIPREEFMISSQVGNWLALLEDTRRDPGELSAIFTRLEEKYSGNKHHFLQVLSDGHDFPIPDTVTAKKSTTDAVIVTVGGALRGRTLIEERRICRQRR